jgi:hypothetical protein
MASVQRCIVLLKYKSSNITFGLVKIINLNVNLFYKWNKE